MAGHHEHAWLLGALARPSMYLLAPGECAENAIRMALEDLAELDDTQEQLDEASRRLRTWLGVGGAPALPVTVAWSELVGQPPSTDAVVALHVGLIAELNLLHASRHDPSPPDLPPAESVGW